MTDVGDQHPHGPGPRRPPYLAGLLLDGRRVVLVGGGHVAGRRIGAMVVAGARVTVIAPRIDPEVRAYAQAGRVESQVRRYRPGDLAGAWYAMAATDDPAVNAAVVAEAEQLRIFCVRADDAIHGTAWTPATGRHGEVTVAVTANRDPRHAAETRDFVLDALRRSEEAGSSPDG